ncbi:MAG TPA: hypothetical protein VJA22_01945 [Patescibacteria group bacterium]|nr:hypothetical protein [Patescibacteria group bacterium]
MLLLLTHCIYMMAEECDAAEIVSEYTAPESKAVEDHSGKKNEGRRARKSRVHAYGSKKYGSKKKGAYDTDAPDRNRAQKVHSQRKRTHGVHAYGRHRPRLGGGERSEDVPALYRNITDGETIMVEATAYANVPEQTDSTPNQTADMGSVHPQKVASNCLPFGTRFRIVANLDTPYPAGFRDSYEFRVGDCMDERYTCPAIVSKGEIHVDFFFPQNAPEFGRKKLQIEILAIGKGETCVLRRWKHGKSKVALQ